MSNPTAFRRGGRAGETSVRVAASPARGEPASYAEYIGPSGPSISHSAAAPHAPPPPAHSGPHPSHTSFRRVASPPPQTPAPLGADDEGDKTAGGWSTLTWIVVGAIVVGIVLFVGVCWWNTTRMETEMTELKHSLGQTRTSLHGLITYLRGGGPLAVAAAGATAPPPHPTGRPSAATTARVADTPAQSVSSAVAGGQATSKAPESSASVVRVTDSPDKGAAARTVSVPFARRRAKPPAAAPATDTAAAPPPAAAVAEVASSAPSASPGSPPGAAEPPSAAAPTPLVRTVSVESATLPRRPRGDSSWIADGGRPEQKSAEETIEAESDDEGEETAPKKEESTEGGGPESKEDGEAKGEGGGDEDEADETTGAENGGGAVVVTSVTPSKSSRRNARRR